MKFLYPLSDLYALVLLAALGCAGPRIPPDPVIPPAPAVFRGPVLQPCVLIHQDYEADRSDALEGGDDGTVRLVFATILIKHPTKGLIVIDPAVGRDKTHDFGEISWLLRRVVGDGSKAMALGDMLTAIAVPPEAVKWALVTHFHWDHIGGAPDVPSAQVLVAEPDIGWAEHARIAGARAVPEYEIDRIRPRLKPFRTEGAAYDGFPSSFDLFGDGSIVAVPTPGHTPGSVSWFVNSGDGHRWLFVGDAAWVLDGISKPAHKGTFGRFADDNVPLLGKTLSRLHAFQKARPVTDPPDGRGVQIITAHDPVSLSQLPSCSRP